MDADPPPHGVKLARRNTCFGRLYKPNPLRRPSQPWPPSPPCIRLKPGHLMGAGHRWCSLGAQLRCRLQRRTTALRARLSQPAAVRGSTRPAYGQNRSLILSTRKGALHSQGQSVADAIRSIGVTEVSYYRWRREFGGLKSDQVKRMKELEAENARLRRAVADLTLDKLILKEAASGNW